MSFKLRCRYIGTWLYNFVQTQWVYLSAWMTFTNIKFFVIAGVLVIGVSYWVGLRDLISVVLLFVLAEETLKFVWIAVSTYIIAKRMKDDVESDDSMQFCYGLVLSQTPRFLASVLAVGIAFAVHIGLGWGFIGTILTAIFIEVFAGMMFGFALMLLVGAITMSTSRKTPPAADISGYGDDRNSDNPNDRSPNAYGYCGTEEEDDEDEQKE